MHRGSAGMSIVAVAAACGLAGCTPAEVAGVGAFQTGTNAVVSLINALKPDSSSTTRENIGIVMALSTKIRREEPLQPAFTLDFVRGAYPAVLRDQKYFEQECARTRRTASAPTAVSACQSAAAYATFAKQWASDFCGLGGDPKSEAGKSSDCGVPNAQFASMLNTVPPVVVAYNTLAKLQEHRDVYDKVPTYYTASAVLNAMIFRDRNKVLSMLYEGAGKFRNDDMQLNFFLSYFVWTFNGDSITAVSYAQRALDVARARMPAQGVLTTYDDDSVRRGYRKLELLYENSIAYYAAAGLEADQPVNQLAARTYAEDIQRAIDSKEIDADAVPDYLDTVAFVRMRFAAFGTGNNYLEDLKKSQTDFESAWKTTAAMKQGAESIDDPLSAEKAAQRERDLRAFELHFEEARLRIQDIAQKEAEARASAAKAAPATKTGTDPATPDPGAKTNAPGKASTTAAAKK
jgi:hypothetical protein